MRSDFSDHTPTDPGSIAAAVRQEARRGIKKLVPALVVLLVAVFTYWTIRVTVATEEAKDAAENAETTGAKGEAVAKTAKVEARAGYAATTDKAVAMADDLAKVVARLNLVEAELERLKGRPRARRRPITLSPKTTADPPPTPAAAAAQDVQP